MAGSGGLSKDYGPSSTRNGSQFVAIEEEQVRLGEAQAQAGTIPYASVLTLRSQVASTRATVPALEERIDQAEHLVATLTGRAPAEWARLG